MYCHNFHLVVSDEDFFFARSSMSCPWVISHMMTMSPNLISLFHRDFYVVGDVCFYSAVSHWFTCYVVASPLWHVVIGRESCRLFFCSQKFLIWLEYTMYCLCIMMRLFTNDGCGNYHQVWCVAFFSKTSIFIVSFGLHQWIKLVDLISMYLAQLVVCSDCREGARQRFLSILSHSSP